MSKYAFYTTAIFAAHVCVLPLVGSAETTSLERGGAGNNLTITLQSDVPPSQRIESECMPALRRRSVLPIKPAEIAGMVWVTSDYRKLRDLYAPEQVTGEAGLPNQAPLELRLWAAAPSISLVSPSTVSIGGLGLPFRNERVLIGTYYVAAPDLDVAVTPPRWSLSCRISAATQLEQEFVVY
jgi:hypothetical protein